MYDPISIFYMLHGSYFNLRMPKICALTMTCIMKPVYEILDPKSQSYSHYHVKRT